MKRYLTGFILLLTLLVAFGCTAARKPEPEPQPRTVVVPEVSRVSFDTVELEKAPKVVRDVAKAMRERDVATWVQSGNNAYIVVSLSENNKDKMVEVDEILQRIPEPGINWLDVKLKYSKRSDDNKNGEETGYAVVRADVNDRPEGVGFETVGPETSSPAPPAPARTEPSPERQAPAPQVTENKPKENNGAEINRPSANQEVTSPVTVSGKIKTPVEKLRVRIITRNGQIMKEEEMPAPGPDTGSFETSLSYNAPSIPKPGTVEVISTDKDGNDKVLGRVPVLIK